MEKKFLRHVEIEALPTGGWGYAYFPYVARFVRPLGLPTLSHTGRFFKSWGDNTSLKPEAALKYECCQVLSQSMSCGVGDLLHPRGVPDKAVYNLIGNVYKYIEACEPYVENGELLSQIAVIVEPELGDNPGPSGLGAVRALQQLRQQFDILSPDAELAKYELVIIPETTSIEKSLKSKLQLYLQSGGALIVCGRAALDSNGLPIMDELGIETYGPSPYSHTFLHAAPNYRILLGNCVNLLLPEPLIRDGGPSKLETMVVRKEDSLIVHLLSFCPERRADNLDIVEDPLPIVDMQIAVKSDKKPRRVYLAPNERDLHFEYRKGYVNTNVTVLDGHSLLVIEI